jgi:hypothetical protein
MYGPIPPPMPPVKPPKNSSQHILRPIFNYEDDVYVLHATYVLIAYLWSTVDKDLWMIQGEVVYVKKEVYSMILLKFQ